MEGFIGKWLRWRRVLWVRKENGKGVGGYISRIGDYEGEVQKVKLEKLYKPLFT